MEGINYVFIINDIQFRKIAQGIIVVTTDDDFCIGRDFTNRLYGTFGKQVPTCAVRFYDFV